MKNTSVNCKVRSFICIVTLVCLRESAVAQVASPDVDPASGKAVPVVPEIAQQGYELVFSDEFKEASLDLTKWQYRMDSKGNSTQVPENVSLLDNALHLAVKKEDIAGKHYSGAGIISKKQFQYGYYEARFRVPPGAGWHTSFWTMFYSEDKADKKALLRQEFDICEQDSSPKHSGYSTGVIAWNSPGPKNLGRIRPKTPDLVSDFHTWSADYTPTAVRMYFDGKLVETIDVSAIKQGPQNIWLTVIGWGRQVDDAQLPSEAQFSYVRCYQKKQ